MFKLSSCIVLLGILTRINAESESRIIGGNPANINDYPFVVSLQRIIPAGTPPPISRDHECGGALINWGFVLTSATCCHELDTHGQIVGVKDPRSYRVMAGSVTLLNEDAQRFRNIQAFSIHPDYIGPPTRLHDIAIITLTNIFSELPGLRPINALGNIRPFENMECTVAGFGAISNATGTPPTYTPSQILHFAKKYVYNQEVCTWVYANMPGVLNVMSNMLCAASFDITVTSAPYDDGNILVCNDLAAGILTYFPGQQAQSFPEIYTRTANYTSWIRQISSANITVPGFLISFVAMLSIIKQTVFSS